MEIKIGHDFTSFFFTFLSYSIHTSFSVLRLSYIVELSNSSLLCVFATIISIIILLGFAKPVEMEIGFERWNGLYMYKTNEEVQFQCYGRGETID